MALQSKDFSHTGRWSGITYTYIINVTENSVDTTNNTSNVTVTCYLQSSYSGDSFWMYTTTVTATINGTTVINSEKQRSCSGTGKHKYATWTGNVAHNADGSLSMKIDGKIWQKSPDYFPSSGITISNNGKSNTLTATKINRNFTLSFNANGGSVSTTSKTVTYGSTYGTLPTPTRTGHTFNGWYTASSGGTRKQSGDTYNTLGNSTLYAQWTVNKYSYNFNVLLPDGSEPWQTGAAGSVEISINGGSWARIHNEAASSYPYGTTFKFRNFTPGTGLKLNSVTGATTNSDGTWSATMGTGGLNINFSTAYQTYTNRIDHWTWGFTKQEGTNGSKNAYPLGSTYFNQTYGSSYSLNTNRATTIPAGFVLRNKFGTSSISGSWAQYNMGTTTTQAAGTMSYEYDYDPIAYSVSYELDGGTNNSSNPTSYNVLYGFSLANPTKLNYNFAGWYKKNAKINYTLSASSGNFNYYTVRTGIKPGDKYCIKIDSATRTAGTATQFTAVFYDFTDQAWVSSAVVNFGNNLEFWLSCPSSYASGHNIHMILYAGIAGATANNAVSVSGLEIQELSTGISQPANSFANTNAFYTAMNSRAKGNVTFVAKWEGKDYTLTINPNGGSWNGSTSAQTFTQKYNTTKVLSEKPTRSGYKFLYWAATTSPTTANFGVNVNTGNAEIPRYRIAKASSTNLEILLYAPNAAVAKCPTWTNTGGQDDLVWHVMNSGSWTRDGYTYNFGLQISIANHNYELLDYITHLYVYNSSGAALTSVGALNLFDIQLGVGDTYYFNVNNYTLYAIWERDVCNITYNGNGNIVSNVPAKQEKIIGTNITLSSTNPTRGDRYKFLGWAESSSATSAAYQPGATFTKDVDTTLYAVWQLLDKDIYLYNTGKIDAVDFKTVPAVTDLFDSNGHVYATQFVTHSESNIYIGKDGKIYAKEFIKY